MTQFEQPYPAFLVFGQLVADRFYPYDDASRADYFYGSGKMKLNAAHHAAYVVFHNPDADEAMVDRLIRQRFETDEPVEKLPGYEEGLRTGKDIGRGVRYNVDNDLPPGAGFAWRHPEVLVAHDQIGASTRSVIREAVT